MKIELLNGWTCISHEKMLKVMQLDSIASIGVHNNLDKYYLRVIMKAGSEIDFGPFTEAVALGHAKKFFSKVGE